MPISGYNSAFAYFTSTLAERAVLRVGFDGDKWIKLVIGRKTSEYEQTWKPETQPDDETVPVPIRHSPELTQA